MDSRRNLLILVADEFTPKCLGALGHPAVKTPNLDRLAAGGTLFTRAYTNSPVCVPARAVIQTGRYVHQTGHWDSTHPYRGSPRGWAHALRERGHAVVSVGKLHFRSSDDDNGYQPEILPMHVKDGVGWVPALLRRPLPVFEAAAELAQDIGPGDSPHHHYDRRVRDAARDWLRSHADTSAQSWALFVSFVCPHYPLKAPTRYYDLYRDADLGEPIPAAAAMHEHQALRAMLDFYDYGAHFSDETERIARASYYGLVSFVDDLIGDVLTALSGTAAAEETTVLFLSDHGEMLGDHGIWTKQVMYEGSVGIPMILGGPGVPAGQRVATPVSLIDVHPTACHAVLGETPGDGTPGRSLIDIANGGDDPDRAVLSEFHDGGSPTGIFMLRRGRWKLVHYEGYRPQLFDLATDPAEVRDLAQDARHGETLDELDRELRAIVDPARATAAAFTDQESLILALGGIDKVREMARDAFNHTPVPTP